MRSADSTRKNDYSALEVVDELSAIVASKILRQEARGKLLEMLELTHNSLGGNSRFWDCLGDESSTAAPQKKPTKGVDSDSIAWLGPVGSLAREAFEFCTSTAHRKQHGQFSTPPTISALACAAAIGSTTASVIDPMCGTGAMLWAATDRLAFLGTTSQARVTGVELDPVAARVAALPPGELQSPNMEGLQVLCADAFLELTGFLPSCGFAGHSDHYDAIVGNPPYIRYQAFASMFKETCPAIVAAFREELPNQSDSAVADTIIRASLIAHQFASRTNDLLDVAREAVTMLRSTTPPSDFGSLEACWLKLVANYSGLADLSLPSWLLTWHLGRPGAIIAHVTTASWKSRQYGRLLRYFMLRMLQPLVIIEQEGNWFDALIPTSLMVLRARSSEEAAVPLRDREKSGHTVRMVRVRHTHNLANRDAFRRLALELNPECMTDSPFELAAYADVIIQAIEAEKDSRNDNLWTISVVPEQTLIDELLGEDRTAQRSRTSGISLQELEGHETQELRPTESIPMDPPARLLLPNAIQQALDLGKIPTGVFRLLADYGIHVNQGLRTGCNPFFYARKLAPQDWAQLFPHRRQTELAAALQRPSDHSERFMTIITGLRRANALVADEPPSKSPPCALVELDRVFTNQLAVLPVSMLRPAVHYQRTLTRWTIDDPELLPHYALVVGAGATLEDYTALSARYPQDWIDTWKTRDGLSVLPSTVSDYIGLAATTKLERRGRRVLIPELSAVAPNATQPPLPFGHLPLPHEDSVPRCPTWWYTLPIRPRHRGLVFMPRVVGDSPRAYLNLVCDPVLIDANFSTFSLDSDYLSAKALFALLNSTWVKAALEATATPMGGGALKVEAAHLRILPIPDLDNETIVQLGKLGSRLAMLSSLADASNVLHSVDALVSSRLAGMIHVDATAISGNLKALSDELRARRNRRFSD